MFFVVIAALSSHFTRAVFPAFTKHVQIQKITVWRLVPLLLKQSSFPKIRLNCYSWCWLVCQCRGAGWFDTCPGWFVNCPGWFVTCSDWSVGCGEAGWLKASGRTCWWVACGGTGWQILDLVAARSFKVFACSSSKLVCSVR